MRQDRLHFALLREILNPGVGVIGLPSPTCFLSELCDAGEVPPLGVTTPTPGGARVQPYRPVVTLHPAQVGGGRTCRVRNLVVHVVSLHRKIRMHSSRMRTACSLPYGGVSVQGVSIQKDLYPGVGPLCKGSLSRAVSVHEGVSLSRMKGVSVQMGVSPFEQND